jgi:hypothetical protein
MRDNLFDGGTRSFARDLAGDQQHAVVAGRTDVARRGRARARATSDLSSMAWSSTCVPEVRRSSATCRRRPSRRRRAAARSPSPGWRPASARPGSARAMRRVLRARSVFITGPGLPSVARRRRRTVRAAPATGLRERGSRVRAARRSERRSRPKFHADLHQLVPTSSTTVMSLPCAARTAAMLASRSSARPGRPAAAGRPAAPAPGSRAGRAATLSAASGGRSRSSARPAAPTRLRQQRPPPWPAQQQLAAGGERTDHGVHGLGNRPRQGLRRSGIADRRLRRTAAGCAVRAWPSSYASPPGRTVGLFRRRRRRPVAIRCTLVDRYNVEAARRQRGQAQQVVLRGQDAGVACLACRCWRPHRRSGHAARLRTSTKTSVPSRSRRIRSISPPRERGPRATR